MDRNCGMRHPERLTLALQANVRLTYMLGWPDIVMGRKKKILKMCYLPHRWSSHGRHHLRHHTMRNRRHVRWPLPHGVHSHGRVMWHPWVSHLKGSNEGNAMSEKTPVQKCIKNKERLNAELKVIWSILTQYCVTVMTVSIWSSRSSRVRNIRSNKASKPTSKWNLCKPFSSHFMTWHRQITEL